MKREEVDGVCGETVFAALLSAAAAPKEAPESAASTLSAVPVTSLLVRCIPAIAVAAASGSGSLALLAATVTVSKCISGGSTTNLGGEVGSTSLLPLPAATAVEAAEDPAIAAAVDTHFTHAPMVGRSSASTGGTGSSGYDSYTTGSKSGTGSGGYYTTGSNSGTGSGGYYTTGSNSGTGSGGYSTTGSSGYDSYTSSGDSDYYSPYYQSNESNGTFSTPASAGRNRGGGDMGSLMESKNALCNTPAIKPTPEGEGYLRLPRGTAGNSGEVMDAFPMATRGDAIQGGDMTVRIGQNRYGEMNSSDVGGAEPAGNEDLSGRLLENKMTPKVVRLPAKPGNDITSSCMPSQPGSNAMGSWGSGSAVQVSGLQFGGSRMLSGGRGSQMQSGRGSQMQSGRGSQMQSGRGSQMQSGRASQMQSGRGSQMHSSYQTSRSSAGKISTNLRSSGMGSSKGSAIGSGSGSVIGSRGRSSMSSPLRSGGSRGSRGSSSAASAL